MTQLVNANQNDTNIVINVLVGDGADENTTVTINKLMNDVHEYSAKAAYLVWNFGDYAGTINIGGTFSGVIVAPKAVLQLTEIQAGRVVAESVSHSAEIHMAVKGTYQQEIKQRHSR